MKKENRKLSLRSTWLLALFIIVIFFIIISLFTSQSILLGFMANVYTLYLGHILLFWPIYNLIYSTTFENALFMVVSLIFAPIYFGLILYLFHYFSFKIKNFKLKTTMLGALLGLLLWLNTTFVIGKLVGLNVSKLMDYDNLKNSTNLPKIYLFLLVSVVLWAIMGYAFGLIIEQLKKSKK